MRMPTEVTPIQNRWFTLHNYRLRDKGKLASYWVNGWPPKEYSIEKEYEYFEISKKEWKQHGEEGYRGMRF